MGLYYYGLQATSAAYSVVFLNLVPIVTFVIAVLVRYVHVRTHADKPKHACMDL
jgi:drug/metabolite transporter (DMT)-like permease